jgi:hypothetical protein
MYRVHTLYNSMHPVVIDRYRVSMAHIVLHSLHRYTYPRHNRYTMSHLHSHHNDRSHIRYIRLNRVMIDTYRVDMVVMRYYPIRYCNDRLQRVSMMRYRVRVDMSRVHIMYNSKHHSMVCMNLRDMSHNHSYRSHSHIDLMDISHISMQHPNRYTHRVDIRYMKVDPVVIGNDRVHNRNMIVNRYHYRTYQRHMRDT